MPNIKRRPGKINVAQFFDYVMINHNLYEGVFVKIKLLTFNSAIELSSQASYPSPFISDKLYPKVGWVVVPSALSAVFAPLSFSDATDAGNHTVAMATQSRSTCISLPTAVICALITFDTQ